VARGVKDEVDGNKIPRSLDPVDDVLTYGPGIVADDMLIELVGDMTSERTIDPDVQDLQL
jgi:hypothetical protein